MLTEIQAESAAQGLSQHPDYRVLQRLRPCPAFAEADGRPLVKGVIVDTETTGLNQDTDKIIEIGIVVFE